MENNTAGKSDIESFMYESLVLWFNPFTEDYESQLDTGESEEMHVGIFPFFDYEILSTTKWIVHIDIEINFPTKAEIRVRTSYEVNCSFEQLFTHTTLDLLYKNAVEYTVNGFNDRYKKIDKAFEDMDVKIFIGYITDFSEKTINRCLARKDEDAMFLSTDINVMNIPGSDFFRFIITSTFLIMDEVLYLNESFNLKNNQEVFHSVIPPAHFYTVRFKCLEILKGDVKLVMSHNIVFHICLDFAIQMLLDKHLDNLLPVITARGLDTEYQQKFIKLGAEFLESSRKYNQEHEIEFVNLEKRYDWNALIK